MKKIIASAISLLLFTCCNGNKMQKELHRVDSLNQNYIPIDTVNTMDDLIAYFEKWGNTEEKVSAHYLMGCVYRDRHDVPRALQCYYDAIKSADTISPDCNYKQLSRIYGQIADLFHEQRAPQSEICAELKAIDYAWKSKDTLSAIVFYTYLSAPYHMLNRMDSALYYSQTAQSLFEQYGRKDLSASCQIMDMSIYLRQHDYQKMKRSIDIYEYYSDFVDSTGNVIRGKEVFYGYKGDYFKGVGQLDSAEYYYRKLMGNISNASNKDRAYRGLMTIYNSLHKSDSVSKYAMLYCDANDSASIINEANEIVKTQALYNYNESDRIATKKTIESERYRHLAMFVVFLTVLISIIAYQLIKRKNQRKKSELMSINNKYNTLLLRYAQIQKEHDLSVQDFEMFRIQKEQEMKQLKSELDYYQISPEISGNWSTEQAILTSDIVKQLHRAASKVEVPSQKQWIDLYEFVKSMLPKFYSKLNEDGNKLTSQERLICILIRLRFIPTEQAALLNVTIQRISNLRLNINRQMFHESTAKTLNDNIFKL